jgi:acyl-CoA oxidase
MDLIHLGRAFMAKVTLDQFQAAVRSAADPDVRGVLQTACNLYALHNIWEDVGTFRQMELIKRGKAAAISDEVRRAGSAGHL